jgi:prepilin-type N-terminal cleavage/methylation domain-containing protein
LERGTLNLEPGTAGARGFTLFELVMCLIVISIVAALLLERLGFYQEMAERAAMEATARAIRTGLQVRLAELIITKRQAAAGALETENPTRWLEQPPANYGGPWQGVPRPATWYYDEARRQLVYVVGTGSRLEIDGAPGGRELRFRALLLRDRVRVPGGRVESVTGVTLQPVTPYHWQ